MYSNSGVSELMGESFDGMAGILSVLVILLATVVCTKYASVRMLTSLLLGICGNHPLLLSSIHLVFEGIKPIYYMCTYLFE